MLSLTGIEQVYLAGGNTDLRKSIDGLAALPGIALDPFGLYKEYLADPKAALAKFDRLLKVDNGSTYSQVATEFGFNCIHKETYYEWLAKLLDVIIISVSKFEAK